MSSTGEFILYLALPIALQSLLLFLLVRNQVRDTYPWFVNYTAFSIAATITRLATWEYYRVYFYVYWGGELIYAALALMALFDVFRLMFRNYLRLRWFRPLFPVAVLVTIGVAVLHAVATRNPAQDQPITVVVLAITFGVRLVQGACFVCLWILVWLTGARWHQPGLGIVTGFGFYASYVLVASLLRSGIGTKVDGLIVYGVPVAYILTLLLWLWFFATSQSSGDDRDSFPPMSREELARYAEVVRRLRK